MLKMLGALVVLVTLTGASVAQEAPTITVRPRSREILVRRAPGTAIVGTAVYIHTWARKYLGESGGVPQFATWHMSDGPYEAGPDVDAMIRTIGKEGLYIGNTLFPVHTILLVEVRTN
jgi:hypothetical protein